MNSPEYKKRQHQRAMNDWLEGERRLNERNKNPKLGIRVYKIGDKVYRPKERPKLVCNLKANTKK